MKKNYVVTVEYHVDGGKFYCKEHYVFAKDEKTAKEIAKTRMFKEIKKDGQMNIRRIEEVKSVEEFE